MRAVLLCSLALFGACTITVESGSPDASSASDASPAVGADASASFDAGAPDIGSLSAPDASTPADSGSQDASIHHHPDAGELAGPDASSEPDASSAADAALESDGSILAPVGPTSATGWALAFQDEFDDSPGMSGPTNGLEASKWNSGWYTTGINATSAPVQSGEVEWYGPEGIVFPGDGSVHLHLFSNSSSTYNKSYESGCITTAGHYGFSASQKRTVIEARIEIAGPNSQSGGYWPAFWLLSHLDGPGGSGQWPPEIDIFEFFGDTTDPEAHLHTTGNDINLGFNDSDGVTDLSTDFHTYTFDASTSALTFYLDGAQKWTHTDAGHISNVLAYDPMYILLNFQFGGAGGGNPTGTVPADMVIDYVRCWQTK